MSRLVHFCFYIFILYLSISTATVKNVRVGVCVRDFVCVYVCVCMCVSVCVSVCPEINPRHISDTHVRMVSSKLERKKTLLVVLEEGEGLAVI